MAKHFGSRASVAGLALAGFILAGFMGAVDCDGSRFRSVASKTASVTVTGYADSASYIVCAYQQTKDGPLLSSPRACVYPNAANYSDDGCGVRWYSFSMTFSLLGTDTYWFTGSGNSVFTRVLISRNVSGGALFTATGDFSEGPANGTACWRSQIAENAALAPLTYYLGSVPDEMECSGGVNSYAGCPFTCNLARGCDEAYGVTQNDFFNYSHRVNTSYQDTSQTRFDHFGPNSTAGTPAGDWGYQYESGVCMGGPYNGWACEGSGNCGGYDCNNYWVVMRRNAFTFDSLNIRRGQSRRNVQVESWVKTKYADANHREIGVVGRYYDLNNYFVFMVREYGGDLARIHRYVGGGYQTVAGPTYPALNLTGWNRLGLKIVDHGSYVNNRWVPSGYCAMSGIVNSSTVVSTSSTACNNAPYGKYGVFTYYMNDAQFWDLDAYPR